MKIRFATIAVLFALVLAACASLNLPPPANAQSTLLLVPFTVDNRSQHGGSQLGFHYDYEIVSLDSSIEPVHVVFTGKVDGDVIVVDSLPPGKYRVASYGVKPAGSGDHSYSGNRIVLFDEFELKPKSITILPRSFNIELYNETPGRSMSTIYSKKIEPVTGAQKTALVNKLREQQYFDQWTLLE